ncbi:MAG: MBL fold metallo-hydrolase [Ekhidna sp.]
MDIRVKFLGGAGTVTGSKYLVEIGDFSVLIDCGLFQGLKALRLRNWDELPVDPSSIDAIVLTHAHIDHTGYLPQIVKNGFMGKVHCTEPTKDLIEILLMDSAKLQEEEAEFANQRGYSKHTPAKPLYTVKEAAAVFPMVHSHTFNKSFRIHDLVEVSFFHAGHILGASSVTLKVYSSQGIKTLVFSGDIGPFHNPLHLKPELPKAADILFIESTYGARNHRDLDMESALKKIIEACDRKRGCLIIPAFSLGRTQLVLYYLWKIFQNTRSRPIYIDSPMAISVTRLYKKYDSFHRLTAEQDFGHPIFDAPFVHYVTEQNKSRLLNKIESNAIIISASGMATGGRILHHLYHRLPNEQDTILFTGFQAEGSRGRSLVSGEKVVKIFGEQVEVKAEVINMDGLSAHADQQELLTWCSEIDSSPKMTFLVHGEKEESEALARLIEAKGWNVTIPEYLSTHTLFDHV